jgi:hypothetical protein
VAVIAVILSVVALVRFSHAAARACAARVAPDPTYQVEWEPAPRTDVSSYRLAVTREGLPVTGARVCLNAYLIGLSAIAVTDIGTEVSPGIYRIDVTFGTAGRWAGHVLVGPPERRVAVPVSINVAAAG